MLVLVALAVAVLLRFAPNVAVPFRWPLVGGFVFAIGWVVATALFALYVANFANYSNTYGALGGVVVLMLWFYLTAVLLLLAAELTSLLAKDHAPEQIAARQREIGGAGAEADAAPEPVADRQVIVVEVPRVVAVRPAPASPNAVPVLLVLGGVIAGALAGLLARDER